MNSERGICFPNHLKGTPHLLILLGQSHTSYSMLSICSTFCNWLSSTVDTWSLDPDFMVVETFEWQWGVKMMSDLCQRHYYYWPPTASLTSVSSGVQQETIWQFCNFKQPWTYKHPHPWYNNQLLKKYTNNHYFKILCNGNTGLSSQLHVHVHVHVGLQQLT